MNGQKIHSTNDFVGGVGFFAVHEQTYIVVHEQWKKVVQEQSLKWTVVYSEKKKEKMFPMINKAKL